MGNKKGQAAMEFLMTYGWGILVVLAAIGALAYFGVLNPSKFFPDACVIPPVAGMACLDFNIFPASAHLLILNSGGRDVEINNITVGDCATTFDMMMSDGQSYLFNITGCSFGTVGSKIKMNVDVFYTDKISQFTKSVTGSITSVLG